MSKELYNHLVRLGTENPNLRHHIRPILADLRIGYILPKGKNASDRVAAAVKIPNNMTVQEVHLGFLQQVARMTADQVKKKIKGLTWWIDTSRSKSRVELHMEDNNGYSKRIMFHMKNGVLQVQDTGGVQSFLSETLQMVANIIGRQCIENFQSTGLH